MGVLNERVGEVHRAMEEQGQSLAVQSLSQIQEELSSSQRQGRVAT